MDRITKRKIILSLLSFMLCSSLAGESWALTISGVSQKEKLPYRPRWVSILKKGKLIKYKRKEFASPAISKDLVFIGSDGGFFYALKKKNGRKIWRFKTGAPVNGTPAFGGDAVSGSVIVGDDKGILHALSMQKGHELWKQDLGSEILAAPAVSGNRVFVTTSEGKVAALSLSDGHILWQKDNPQPGLQMTIRGSSGLAVDSGKLYVGFSDGSLWALSEADGRSLWQKSLPTTREGFRDLDGTPLIDGDRLYVATFDGGVYALAKSNGQILWSHETGSGVKLASQGDRLYVSGSDGTVYAFHKKDGKEIWKTPIGRGALTTPVVYQDLLVVGLSGSTVNFLSLQDGHVMARRFARKGLFSDPIVDEGKIYYLSNGGRMYSLSLIP